MTDYLGKEIFEARAPVAGVILYICAVPSMTKGATISNVGVVARQEVYGSQQTNTMALEAGTSLGRYEIRSKIGAGGMGEVYLAEDTQLRRSVALKILPAEIAANKDRMRRFVQEAQAAAALNHPNIAHIYEIGEQDGLNFIAMEFIEGHTLREFIHGRQTGLAKLLRYLQHVAEGLAKAHAAGIVHRDVKPDNIMIRSS